MSVVFNLKSVISVSMMKKDEENFKEMIETEYSIRIRLITEENEMNLRSLQGGFSLNLTQTSQNQLMEFATNLKEKFQETVQVRYATWHPYNIWEMKERRAKIAQPLTTMLLLK